MITIKLPIQTTEETKNRILKYQKQYSSLLHVYFNRYKEGLTQTECKHLELNNVELLDSWFRQSCIYEAIALVKSINTKVEEFNNKMKLKDKLLLKTNKTWKEKRKLKKLLKLKKPTPIFGGKNNFILRSHKSISKEEFNELKLSKIYSIGENNNKSVKGNRKFFIQNLNTIIFKPSKFEKLELLIKVSSKNYRRYLELLKEHQELKDLSITYKLSSEYIWISFDESILKDKFKQFKKIKNRIISIDMNPNYIGWSIIDWTDSEKFNIIDKGVLSIKTINDKSEKLIKEKTNSSDLRKIKLTNKRNFEVLQCSKFLIEKMKHFKCSIFAIEDLDIEPKDISISKKHNRLCNSNWCRNKLVNNLSKWCNIYNVQLLKVKPEYSSFIGNLVYRYLKLPDMVLSSIEISRRGYEFYHQYILKDKEIKKNIIFIELTERIKELICQSLEELSINIQEWSSLFDLFNTLKKSKRKYRFPLVNSKVFKSNSLKFQLII